jgi:hypothetical protein
VTFPYDQARLQALFSEVDSRIDDLGKVATAASQVQRRSRGLSEQDLAAIERFAKSPGAPKELKDLQRLPGDRGGPGPRRHRRVRQPGRAPAAAQAAP